VPNAEVYAQFIHLDTDERTALSSAPQNMLITQTQKAIASASKSSRTQLQSPNQIFAVAVVNALLSAADQIETSN
jgi:hypothetical protein